MRRLDLDLVALASDVPDFDHFPTVDELTAAFQRLADDHPDVATLHRVGTSRLGDPLTCLTIGGGEADAVVFAGPHPNEPIGGLTALHLATILCRDEALRSSFGLRWHVIGCIDPDGSRLNEGWFNGPMTRGHYGRHFYRPAPDEQVEWTFPFVYKDAYFDRVMPETLALMRLIDDTRPVFMSSLHNGENGGVFYYLNRPAPELYEHLYAAPRALGIPIDTSKPEVPYVAEFSPGVYEVIRGEGTYDFLESVGNDPTDRVGGGASWSYAERWGTLTIVTEVPYWAHRDANDETPSDLTYADVLRRRASGLEEVHRVLGGVLDTVQRDLKVDSPYLSALKWFVPGLPGHVAADRLRAEDPESARSATVAERFHAIDVGRMFAVRYGGMLLSALSAELAAGNRTPRIRAQFAHLSEVFEKWTEIAEGETAGEPIPIRHLVGVQLAAILAGARQAVAEAKG